MAFSFFRVSPGLPKRQRAVGREQPVGVHYERSRFEGLAAHQTTSRSKVICSAYAASTTVRSDLSRSPDRGPAHSVTLPPLCLLLDFRLLPLTALGPSPAFRNAIRIRPIASYTVDLDTNVIRLASVGE